MNLLRLSSHLAPVLAGLVLTLATSSVQAQHGAILVGAGATNRSMGGASTAAPLGPAGALFWNPATLSGLERSELEIGAELLFPDTSVRSSVAANALGLGLPPIGLTGSTVSDSGAYALPTLALAYRPEGSNLTCGLGIFAVAGFGTDYPGSTSNPLLTPRPPAGLGIGPVFSDYQVLQIQPALSYQVTERLSIGAGPTANLATLRVDPFLGAAPDDANGNGVFTYPQANHNETTWGGGFSVGAFYQGDGWAVGVSYKSEQWFDTFRFNSADELGRPRKLTFGLDLPSIVSLGLAYTGLERWVLAADVRYIDYESANGFGNHGFNPDGSVKGLGFRSILAGSLGAQFQLSDAISLRAGYILNENPVREDLSFLGTVAPVLIQHTLTLGASWRVTPDFTLSAAYLHAFENSISGPLLVPAGPLAGTSIQNTASADAFVIGASVKFGCVRRCVPVCEGE